MLIFTSRWKPNQQPPPIVSWQNGTYDQIKAMLDAHDAGTINIYDYWNIGDKRTVSLSAISSRSTGAFVTAMAAQNVVMILTNKGYENQSGIHYVVSQENLLNQYSRMNDTLTNSVSWDGSDMRADLNSLYYDALEPGFKSLLKPFNVRTATNRTATTLKNSQDYCSLFASKEMSGNAAHSNETEYNALSAIKYYETTSNRIKYKGSSACTYWTRSPGKSSTDYYVTVKTGGASGYTSVNNSTSSSIAPFCCI